LDHEPSEELGVEHQGVSAAHGVKMASHGAYSFWRPESAD
jgi:hypothetical protein